MTLVATSLSLGYAIGVNSANAKRSSADGEISASTARKNEELNDDEEDGEEDEEEVADGDLSAVNPRFLEPCKMVNICVCDAMTMVLTNTDLL